MFFICDYIKNLFTTNDKINIKEEETDDTIYNQSLLNLPNDKCLLCNNKFKKNRYNIFIKCDNCNKIWSTCYKCPELLENIKYRIGEYKTHNNIDYFICYKCYEN
jgi:hypothetical protein